MEGSLEKKFKCVFVGCGKSFANKYYLKNHGITHSDERPYKCKTPNCPYASKTRYDLHMHQVVHTTKNRYRCIIEGCPCWFKRQGSMYKHIREQHPEERPFKCERKNCNRDFNIRKEYVIHVKEHKEKKRKTNSKVEEPIVKRKKIETLDMWKF